MHLFFRIFAEIPFQTNKWYHDILHQLEKSYPVAFDKAVQLNANLIGLIPGYTARNDIFQRLNHPESNVRLEAINYIKSQDKLCKVSNNNNYDSGYKILDKAEPHCTNGPHGLFAAGKPQVNCILAQLEPTILMRRKRCCGAACVRIL